MQVENRLVILLHIPKTAGTSLRSVFQRQFAAHEFVYYYRAPSDTDMRRLEALDQEPPEVKRRYRGLSGHMPYGIHRQYPQESIYLTMLRAPVSQVLSHYHFIRRNPINRAHAEVSQLSLEDFVQTGRGSNFQTRLLAGEAGEDYNNDPELLERARQHLDTHFITPGTTERFDESLLIFQHELGWRFPYYVRRMTNENSPARQGIDPATRALIEAQNQLDLALYAWAEQKLQAAIDAYGPAFESDLARFRRINALFGRAAQVARTARSWVKPR